MYLNLPDLTDEQQEIFDQVRACVLGESNEPATIFYVDGPAGAGKTFLYRTLQMYLRGAGKIVLVVAMSGIAALLLDGGHTVHARFKLPVPLPLEGAVANISASSGLAQLLRNTDLLIWDEATPGYPGLPWATPGYPGFWVTPSYPPDTGSTPRGGEHP